MTTPRHQRIVRGRWSPLRVFLVAFGVFLGLTASWAVTSPLIGVPDEPSHAIHAAAVARGELTGADGAYPSWKLVQVPEYIEQAEAQACFAQHFEISAGCAPHALTDSDRLVEARTTAGTYNPLYYFPVGLPSLFLDGAPAMTAMRLVSALLCSLLLAGAAVAVSGMRSRSFTLIGLGVGVTPMVLFLSGAINPSGLEFSAAAMTFAWLLRVAEAARDGRVGAGSIVGVVIGAAVLANTRSIAVAWLAAFLVATLADLRVLRVLVRSVWFWVGVGLIGVAVGASVLWTVATTSLSVSNPAPGAGASFPSAFLHMIGISVDSIRDYVGVFGWLDTPIPAGTTYLWGALLLVLVAAALLLGRGAPRWTTLLTLAALVLLPAIIQGRAAKEFGFIWQGRYSLALVLALVLAAGAALDHAYPDAFARARMPLVSVAVIALLGVLQVYVFLFVAHRYVVGGAAGWSAMFRAPLWQPPGTWELWTVVMILSVTGGGLAVRRVIRRDALVATLEHDRRPAETAAASSDRSDRPDRPWTVPAEDDVTWTAPESAARDDSA